MTASPVVPVPSVRVATDADIPVVIAMATAAAASLDGTRGADIMLTREAVPPDAAQLTAWIAAEDAAVLVGQLDDVPVATGAIRVEILSDGTRLAVVPMLWVDDEARAVSVGEALLGGLLEWSREHGCAAIDAYALPGERITKNFFEANGFKARLLTVHHKLDGPS